MKYFIGFLIGCALMQWADDYIDHQIQWERPKGTDCRFDEDWLYSHYRKETKMCFFDCTKKFEETK